LKELKINYYCINDIKKLCAVNNDNIIKKLKNMNLKKISIGIMLGIVAGILDVIPMIIQKLTWDANISAFIMWMVAGFFIAATDLRVHSIIKGIVIGYLVLLPSVFIIGWNEPLSLVPIFIMTTVLGGLLGYSIEKVASRK